MTTEAQPPTEGVLSPDPAQPSPTPTAVVPPPPTPVQAPVAPPAAAPVAEEAHAPAVPVILPPHSVEDMKELERFRLGVWLTKTIVLTMVTMLVSMMVIYTYTAYVTKSVPDMGVMGTIFGHLKEVFVIIIESQK